jgi:hypothetical protein
MHPHPGVHLGTQQGRGLRARVRLRERIALSDDSRYRGILIAWRKRGVAHRGVALRRSSSEISACLWATVG